MLDHTERWRELCKQAETEQDPKKLAELEKEITWLLAEKRHRLEARETSYHNKYSPTGESQ